MARRTVSLHVALLGGAALALLMGCQREAAPQPAVSSCPPAPACSSDCPPEGSGLVRPVAGPVAVPTVFAPPAVPELQASGEIGELSASASRKMFHDDGAGCLADLERIAKLQPSLDKQMAAIRGQCEMLVGKCQEGKKRIADYFVVETNMSPERAAMTAEQMGSMRCRGGNSTPRDELLRASLRAVRRRLHEQARASLLQGARRHHPAARAHGAGGSRGHRRSTAAERPCSTPPPPAS
jgi:hypothetical protein